MAERLAVEVEAVGRCHRLLSLSTEAVAVGPQWRRRQRRLRLSAGTVNVLLSVGRLHDRLTRCRPEA